MRKLWLLLWRRQPASQNPMADFPNAEFAEVYWRHLRGLTIDSEPAPNPGGKNDQQS